MKKILTLFIVVGHMLTVVCGSGTDDISSEIIPQELDILTAELRTIQSTVKGLQDQVIAHERTAGLSTPPLFCLRFIGDPRVENVVQIRDMQSQIAYIQDAHDITSDETIKAKLAQELIDRRAAFDSEMEKKSQYEAAVAELLRLKTELDACSIRMQEIQRDVRDRLPQELRKMDTPVVPDAVRVFIAKAFFNQVSLIAQDYIVTRAKELNIHAPPKFCSQYVDSANVRNTDVIEKAQKDLDSMQEQVDIASKEDTPDMQAILNRKKNAFDLEMGKAAAYEEKAKALASYQGKVNALIQTFVADLSPAVANKQEKPEDLHSFLKEQLPILRTILEGVN